MTPEEYIAKYKKYIEKEQYYHKKALDIEIKYHEQINREKEKKNKKK